jgi:MSHA pilin protein MshA
MKKTNQQKGFTMIELVVVIVVTGVLAAVAVPKFMGVTKDARISAMDGIADSLSSQLKSTYAKSMMGQEEASATSTLQINNVSTAMIFGYPAGTAAALANLLDLGSEYKTTDASGVATIEYSTGLVSCNVAYTEASSATVAAKVVTTTSGC